MMAMNAIPTATTPQHPFTNGKDSDSDDDDVAFAYTDFDGVDFGDEDDEVKEVADEEPSVVLAEENGETSAVDAKDEVKDIIMSVASSMVVDVSTSTSTLSSGSITSNHQTGRKKVLSSVTIIANPNLALNVKDQSLLSFEKEVTLPRPHEDACKQSTTCTVDVDAMGDGADVQDVKHLVAMLENGKYADILRSSVAVKLFGTEGAETGIIDHEVSLSLTGEESMMEQIKTRVLDYCSNASTTCKSAVTKCIEMELLGIASLNLFLQLNYTGPSMDRGMKPEEKEETTHPLDGINPHGMFQAMSKPEARSEFSTVSVSVSSPLDPISEDGNTTRQAKVHTIHSLKETNTSDSFHNAVLSELTVDGEWPYQVCIAPYFLLFARSVLSLLAEPTRPFRLWTKNNETISLDDGSSALTFPGSDEFAAAANLLKGATLWNSRAVVAHRRLIQTRRDDDDGEACPTLWNEADAMFSHCISDFCEQQLTFDDEQRNTHLAAAVMLEWGLAQHHFRKAGRGKRSFDDALGLSKLDVEVTGAEGVRTKYQKKATAQYLVRARPTETAAAAEKEKAKQAEKQKSHIESQMIKHDDVSDDAILLEKIKFEEEGDNVHHTLSILDQSILLALCLDVKNDNPMDGLTGEQMGAYLARVLNQHDDWMVYATGLLERAWLECERVHGRERAILQIQALADQHSNRLTLTQSTFKSVEDDSAPAQERLRHLHGIVYPPRWDMLRDLAERYAKLGVVTSAAELFEEIELWDDVVECYRIAGKERKAEEIIRKRLAEKETPRMYAALGDITKDPSYFEKSLELSHGKYYDAHVALGKYHFDKGDIRMALKHYMNALETKPLMPTVWFRVGTIGMQLKEWDTALRAFTEVVQQEPEEGDAWANVAAIHMHRKNPLEAYPALNEVRRKFCLL